MAEYFATSAQALRQRVETALAQIQELQARLDVLRTVNAQRLIALEEWRANGEDLAVDTRAEGLTDVEDTLPSDRAETELADLERRLEQLEQARVLAQYQQRDQEMSY